MCLVFQSLIHIERRGRFLVVVHHRADGLNHGAGRIRLKDVASHIDAAGALIDRFIGHVEGIQLGQLLAAGNDDRHRAAGDHALFCSHRPGR